jgi:uncharacterized membrane protein YqjE
MASNALSLVHTRLALAGIELAEERDRLKNTVVLVIVGVVFAAFALMTATLFVISLFWDTHREGAIIGVTLFYALVAGVALWRASTIRRDAPAPFAATLAELEKDRERFARKLTR